MNQVYHYTKLGALPSILGADGLDLRETYFKVYSKDDYEWIRDISQTVVKDLCEKNNWEYDPDMLNIKPFICSFCTNPNSNHMWEIYADNCNGVKLIIDKELLQRHRHSFGFKGAVRSDHRYYIDGCECFLPCVYINNEDELSDYLMENINIPEMEGWQDSDKLMLLCAAIKKHEFLIEEEFRHITLYNTVMSFTYNPEDPDNPIMTDDPDPEGDFNYLHHLYDKEVLIGIEFGKNVTDEKYDEILKLLSDNGYDLGKLQIIRQGA